MLIFFHAIVHKCLLFIYLKYICYTVLMSSLCSCLYLPYVRLMPISCTTTAVYKHKLSEE